MSCYLYFTFLSDSTNFVALKVSTLDYLIVLFNEIITLFAFSRAAETYFGLVITVGFFQFTHLNLADLKLEILQRNN